MKRNKSLEEIRARATPEQNEGWDKIALENTLTELNYMI
jgi:hypothetical protein